MPASLATRCAAQCEQHARGPQIAALSPRARWAWGYRFARASLRERSDEIAAAYVRERTRIPYAREATLCLEAREYAAHVERANAWRGPKLAIPAGAPRFALLTLRAAEEQIGAAA